MRRAPHRSNIIMTNDSLCSAEYKKQTECVRSLALFLPLFSGGSYLGILPIIEAAVVYTVHRVNYLHGPTYYVLMKPPLHLPALHLPSADKHTGPDTETSRLFPMRRRILFASQM